jgi:isoleucyl-tRNA synthetase
MYWIAEAMVRWLAPILSFTAEEIWRHMPGERAESVFFTAWADIPATDGVVQTIDWPKVLEARAAVLRELERLRVAEQIGAPLDAEVTLYGTSEWMAALEPLGDELRFVLITSEARVADAGSRPAGAIATDGEGKSGLWLHVWRSESQKCARCWHRRPDVGTVSAHPELCGRCAVNLDGPGETRRYA